MSQDYKLPGPDGDEVRDAREVSPLTGDYIERADGSKHSPDRDYVEFNCPTCEHSITPADIVLEGGGTCPGCGRNVRLFIASYDRFAEWRNVPERLQEFFR